MKTNKHLIKRAEKLMDDARNMLSVTNGQPIMCVRHANLVAKASAKIRRANELFKLAERLALPKERTFKMVAREMKSLIRRRDLGEQDLQTKIDALDNELVKLCPVNSDDGSVDRLIARFG